MDWKKIGAIATFSGFGYWAYKLYTESKEREQKRAREEREEYAQQERERAAKLTEQKFLQERLIEEVEAPFMRYCDAISGFGFGRGFLELRDKLERASQESGNTDSSNGETLSNSQAKLGAYDETSSDTNAGDRVGEKVDSSTAQNLSELAQDSRICDEKSGLSSDWQGSYLSGNDCRQSRRIYDLSRKAESTRNAKLFQKMREINAYIERFSPTHDELLKALSLGQEMFDRVSRAKPFAQFMQASKSSGGTTQEDEGEQNTPRAKELIKLYEAAITSLSGDEEQIVWGGGCIFPIIPAPIYDKLSDTKWRYQWLFNTGLTLPLQVCMMKHLQSIFGIEPANFTTAVSKLAKAAAHKYRIIGLDDDKDDEPKTHISSVSGVISVAIIKIHQQTPRAMKSGIYAYILRDIGERYGELLQQCAGDREKLESSIEAWDSAALTL